MYAVLTLVLSMSDVGTFEVLLLYKSLAFGTDIFIQLY